MSDAGKRNAFVDGKAVSAAMMAAANIFSC